MVSWLEVSQLMAVGAFDSVGDCSKLVVGFLRADWLSLVKAWRQLGGWWSCGGCFWPSRVWRQLWFRCLVGVVRFKRGAVQGLWLRNIVELRGVAQVVFVGWISVMNVTSVEGWVWLVVTVSSDSAVAETWL